MKQRDINRVVIVLVVALVLALGMMQFEYNATVIV
ncbi:hypothetical protein CTKA_00357 [Chthonomonas calidirosea]|uniref:Uncharacterized protein n=1 Tax=Chthonomonas calidirosea (strain DSM 23976 / ICMP 18418 / T49) TaxID=1303518 RepID=S0EXV1_CHTCT|nr:hypothetical protein CCALI_00798 [Chthonomonas calidirosea T49]CEK14254.1 hypothetical protein CTKA_00357 [Chthonomonas calidirosea]